MELVQWIVPDADDGSLAVLWAPVWADRVTTKDGVVRRRGAPLVSRWLTTPLSIGVPESADAPKEGPPQSGRLSVVFAVAVDAKEPSPLLTHHADDVRFATVLAELVRVVADLSEAAGVPAASLVPSPERRGLEVHIGALGTLSATSLADALVLFRVAVESALLARGLQLSDARVKIDAKSAALDGKIATFLTSSKDHL